MDDGARVTTAIVGLLIAFCALLLAKWLAVVALAALLAAVVLRRVVRAVRARRAPAGVDRTVPVTDTDTDTAIDRVVGAIVDRVPATVVPVTAGASPCSWCGLAGGHRDAEGRRVRPRHAHALPAPARRAS